jgi:signal transduction histidine kinase
VTDDEVSGRGSLRPRARLLRTLGNDLISSDKVAIIELVKNSYDADASHVLIRFVGPLVSGKGRIEIWDDGIGMSVETLETSWLEIATDTKKRNSKSESGRRVLGEKGIGRLAAARLGMDLLLTTRSENSAEVALLIDWSQFDQPGAYLDEVQVAWDVSTPEVFDEGGRADQVFRNAGTDTFHSGRGTLLQIDRLTRDWDRSAIDDLVTALARLVRKRPGPPQRDLGFAIHLEFEGAGDELANLNGEVEASSDFTQPHYRLRGSVDATGAGDLHYSQLYPPSDEHLDRYQLWNNDARLPESGPFEFDLSVWDRDRKGYELTVRSAERDGVAMLATDLRTFRADLDSIAGVSVYRDDFRVLPFGERDDDWLRLDLRRVQNPTLALSNNQIIGHVFIGADENEQLRDQSNREGLLEGPAYEDMRQLVLSALSIIETRRYRARRPAHADEPGRSSLFGKFDFVEIREAVDRSHPSSTRLIGLLDEKSRELKANFEEVQQTLSQYSRLATLGTLVDRVIHDGRTIITQIQSKSRFARRDLDKLSVPCEDRLQTARGALSLAEDQATRIDALFGQIEPFGGRRRGRPRKVDVTSLLARVTQLFEIEAEEKGISLEVTGDSFEVSLDESEALTVLTNLVSNAIYWTSTVPKGGVKAISVGAFRNDDGSVALVVNDSGPGVQQDLRETIFDPYFSSKTGGVGLGLSIAGNITTDIYGGELILSDRGPHAGATFEAVFRKRV